jgi:hypothetical protein
MKLFKKINSTGIWIPCDGNDTDKTKLGDCIIDRYIREGHFMVGGTEALQQAMQASSAFVHSANEEFSAGADSRKKKGSQQQTDIVGRAENFMITECPDAAFSQMLLQMKDLPVGGADVPFAPMTEPDIIAYTQYLVREGPIDGMAAKATGRGVEYPTIARVSSAINSIHRLAKHPQPFKDNDKLKDYLCDLHDNYTAEGTSL